MSSGKATRIYHITENGVAVPFQVSERMMIAIEKHKDEMIKTPDLEKESDKAAMAFTDKMLDDPDVSSIEYMDWSTAIYLEYVKLDSQIKNNKHLKKEKE